MVTYKQNQPRNRVARWSIEKSEKLKALAGTKPVEEISIELEMPKKDVIAQCGRLYLSYRFPPVKKAS